jgi:hypothetical protein
VNVLNAGHGQRCGFGCGEQFGVDAVHEMDHDLGGDLPADVDDEAGDDKSRYPISPGQPRSDTDETEQRPRRGEGVEPGMVSIGHKSGSLDAPPDAALIADNYLVADDADSSGGHAQGQMGGMSVVSELVDTDYARKDGAGPDGQGDAQSAMSSARS